MNRAVKVILLVPFLACSWAIGYFMAKKKYELLADKEVEDVKNKLLEHYNGQQKKDELVVDDAKCETKKVITQTSSIGKNEKTESQYFNYAKQYMTENVEKKVEAREEAEKKDNNKSEPYIISMSEYENSDLVAKTLYYYTKEQALTDWDGRPIDFPNEVIGDAALREIEKQNSDTIYVRNDKLKADFEIIIVYGSMFAKPSNERVVPEEYEN